MKYVFLFLFSFLNISAAEAMSTSTLAQACKDVSSFNTGFCVGYIGGIYEGILLSNEYENLTRSVQGKSTKDKSWCLPEGTEFNDMLDAFLKFLNDYPSFVSNDIDAEVAVHSFFSGVYGCRK